LIGLPDDLVHLDLHADPREGVGHDVGGQVKWSHLAENGREEDGVDAVGPTGNAREHLRPGPGVIFLRADDEFHFVTDAEEWQVFRAVARALSTAGTFQVHDAVDANVDGADVMCAAGLDQHGVARVAQTRHEGVDTLLQQGLAAGDFDQLARVRGDFFDNIGERAALTLIKSVFRIAIGAAQVAAGESHKDARLACVGTLPLNAVEYLVDRERFCRGLRFGGFDSGAHCAEDKPNRSFLK